MKIEGASQVKAGDIEKRILTSQTSWIPFSTKEYFDPDVWKTDLRRIERYYRERGYYQAKVIDAKVTPRPKHEVDVVAKVDEGQPTVIASLAITGLDDLPPDHRQQVLDVVGLKSGQVFEEEKWEGLKKKILNTLEELGYAAATVSGEAKVGLDTQRADVLIAVGHGPRYKFGAVHARQHERARVEPWRILEQAAAAATPGDWYSLSAQGEAQTRVFQMGVFGAVKIKPETPDPLSLTVPLEVDTQESPFHSIRAGGGIGVDQLRQEVRAFAQYTNRDFVGGLRKLTLNATVGWAWLPDVFTSPANGGQNGLIGDVSAELQQPRLGFRDLSGDVRLELQKGLEPAYSFYGGKAKIGLVWKPSPYLSIYPSYNIEFYHLLAGAVQLNTTAPTLLFGCPENCLLSYAEERVEWDKRDDHQEPKRGYYLAVTFQEGGGFLGGSFDYFKIQPEARGYVSFLEDRRLTIAARIKVGTLNPTRGTESPIVSRFFSGGNDMRGFNSRYLAPLFVAPKPNSTTDGYVVPVGGNGLAEGSLEARYNVTGPLVVAAFYDTGYVSPQSLDGNTLANLYHAVGAGARYRTPIGPIRLDFAYRLDIGDVLPQSNPLGLSYQTRSGCFGLGRSGPKAGAPEGPCTLQISVGEAF